MYICSSKELFLHFFQKLKKFIAVMKKEQRNSDLASGCKIKAQKHKKTPHSDN